MYLHPVLGIKRVALLPAASVVAFSDGGSLIESQLKRATYIVQQTQDADVPIPEEEALDHFE
jgi:hypothetical protein